MSTLDFFVEKGEKIGFDKALLRNTRNMLLEGFSVSTICRALEVTPEFVARVEKELNKWDFINSALDIFVEKGRQEEREKAIRNLVKISQLTDEQIASAFEVTPKYVSQIRSEIAGK